MSDRIRRDKQIGDTMNGIRQYWLSNLLFLIVLIIGLTFGGFRSNHLAFAETTLGCNNLDIVGNYDCSVACIARDVDDMDQDQITDELVGFKATGETDSIAGLNLDQVGETDNFYQVNISSGEFREVEIGPFVGCTLHTATESVSDGRFPVLEEYIFEDGSGEAQEFTKVVRNPSQESFKTCKVSCTRR